MAAARLTTLWTVLRAALHHVLAALGLLRREPAAAPAVFIPAQSTTPAPAPWRVIAPRFAVPRERSLPPTIKQRIRAEAHGSSPSVRRVCLASPEDAGAACP